MRRFATNTETQQGRNTICLTNQCSHTGFYLLFLIVSLCYLFFYYYYFFFNHFWLYIVHYGWMKNLFVFIHPLVHRRKKRWLLVLFEGRWGSLTCSLHCFLFFFYIFFSFFNVDAKERKSQLREKEYAHRR